MTPDDSTHMTCERSRDAISAIVDGEDPGVAPRIVEAHLAHCAACREFQRVAERTRRLAVGVAPDMPDLSRRVTKAAAVADRMSRWGVTRGVLAVVAVQILVFSVPNLAVPDETGTTAHDARHLGAFTAAYAVALLVVVARPARARTVLPVACVLAGALAVTAVIDLANGNVPFIGEAQHIPELLSVFLIWALATPTRRRAHPDTQPVTPHLEVVDDAEREAG